MRLEDKLIGQLHSGEEIDEEELLLVLGVPEDKISEYKTKLDLLEAEFEVYMGQNDIPYYDPEKLAIGLKDFLWKDKKERYNGNFLLSETIDAQLSSDDKQKVGSCVGLTALYWSLASRFGLKQEVMVSYGHIFSRVILDELKEKYLDIDNTSEIGKVDKANYSISKEYGFEGLLVGSLLNRSNSKNKKRDLAGALKDINKTLKFNVIKGKCLHNRAYTKERLGDLRGAFKDIGKAVELSPKDPLHRYNKGKILLSLNQDEKAKDYFEEAFKYSIKRMELFPNKARYHWNHGNILLALKRNEEALRHYEKASDLEPKSIPYIKKVIKTREKLGDIVGALATFNWLMLVDKEDAKNYYQRGKLKEKIGDTAGALQDYDKAVELNPKYKKKFLK